VHVEIRLFSKDDTDAIVTLSLRAWEPVFTSLEETFDREILSRLRPDWRADQRRAVEEVLTTPANEVWVAVADTRVADFAAMKLGTEKPMGELSMIAVDPQYQNDGMKRRSSITCLDACAPPE
jgi:ribosomal protein S18 acetylase RimI-like enzyme